MSMSDAAGIIRNEWWGDGPGPRWTMARELAIWKKLARLDGPEVVNGAMSVLFDVAPNLERPCHLTLFQGPLYEQCKARWLETNETVAVNLGGLVKPIPTALDKHQQTQVARRAALKRLAEARRGESP